MTVKGDKKMLEYLWYTLAAVLAGVGTGLVGLSAATAMVPILIVLCPSFAGETGAYQATAIALASDILGSAVTTATYISHRNIDLKRGWIMLPALLGHYSVGFTLDTYTHVTGEMQKDAAQRMGSFMAQAV